MKSSNVDRVRLPKTVLEAALDAWGQTEGRHLIPISGRSMLPTIHDGDHALVSHGCAGVRPGDVVVFRHEGTLIAHRVLRIEHSNDGPIFVTKGDNVPRLDPHFSAGEIVGRVLAIERNGRTMSLDTAAWRLSGWLITVGTLVWAGLYGGARGFKQRLLGPQPTRVTAIMRRVVLAFFTQAFTLSQAITCRWKKSARAPSKNGLSR